MKFLQTKNLEISWFKLVFSTTVIQDFDEHGVAARQVG